MSERLTLSLDAMGGDHAPHMVVEGMKIARKRYPDVEYVLFGDEGRIAPLVPQDMRDRVSIRHTDRVISNEEKPSQAVRTGRQSSMGLAIKAVKEGEAAGVVSAGNTGALMAMAKLALRTLPGIDRPAIATLIPTIRGESVMLDLGANTEVQANNLVEFAIMGEVFSRCLLGHVQPSIGLLNIGSEDLKGTDALREAHQILREHPLNMRFHGFVEGDDIGAGTVDVVVTDGFTGNVALKTAEGTAKLYTKFLKDAFGSSVLAQIGYLLAKGALAKVRQRTDPRRYNGAMLIGLNGICVKSHGGTDALGFANAIGVAVDLIKNRLNERIREECAHLAQSPTLPGPAESSSPSAASG
ncbi:phosphate acyltransferase PlsX [Caenispirillum salinarum]|uniref:phosphate acyltransferase PlsX n=1 Tax=Caenispirillum salinarum TaxID=859058 RepID=UPI00384DE51E